MDSNQTETNKKSNDKQSVTNGSVSENFNDIKKDTIPGAIQGQNIGHNSKKEGLGPNTRR